VFVRIPAEALRMLVRAVLPARVEDLRWAILFGVDKSYKCGANLEG